MSEALGAVAVDVLGVDLQCRTVRVPPEHSAAIAVGDEVRELAELQRSTVVDMNVVRAPHQLAAGRDLVGIKKTVAAEALTRNKRYDDGAIVGGMEIGQRVVV